MILIGEIDLLRELFGTILTPLAVLAELQHPHAPEVVRRWIGNPPAWIRVAALQVDANSSLGHLDPGERDAIALAEECGADQILLDDGDARREAARRKLPFIGKLGVLRAAAN